MGTKCKTRRWRCGNAEFEIRNQQFGIRKFALRIFALVRISYPHINFSL